MILKIKTTMQEMEEIRFGFYSRFIKRALDFVISFVAILLLLPLLAVVALLVRLKLGSPVIFKQARPGKQEKIFTLLKFRTMTNETGADGELLADEIRLTKFGRFLRSSSLDELPELFNILMGDMSIVGPRPLLVQYLPLYSAEQKQRHIVRPGLTGLAQASGRNALSWTDKFELDVQYVKNLTFYNDIKVILFTIQQVVCRKGISFEQTQSIYEALSDSKIMYKE